MARTARRIITLSLGLAVLVGSGVAALVIAAAPAGALTPGEGTGPSWCASYRGQNIGSYRDIYACKPHGKGAGKTPFDSFPGFQPTELANRFLFKLTGHTLFDNEVGGNYVALASAAYAIPDSASGAAGRLPVPGDIISMWSGRSRQKQNGNRTLVAVVTGVAPTTSGWTVTTLNQGSQADSGPDGFDTINVSGGGQTWSTENGFYTAFDWLRLASVTCPSAAACVAVGDSVSSGQQQGLPVTRNGHKLTAARAPLPAGAATRQGLPGAQITSVACPAGSS